MTVAWQVVRGSATYVNGTCISLTNERSLCYVMLFEGIATPDSVIINFSIKGGGGGGNSVDSRVKLQLSGEFDILFIVHTIF